METLAEAQRRALKFKGEPLHLLDPETREEYVLVPASTYQRLQSLLFAAEPLTSDEMQALALLAGQLAGWDDPAMDVYNDYPRTYPQRP